MLPGWAGEAPGAGGAAGFAPGLDFAPPPGVAGASAAVFGVSLVVFPAVGACDAAPGVAGEAGDGAGDPGVADGADASELAGPTSELSGPGAEPVPASDAGEEAGPAFSSAPAFGFDEAPSEDPPEQAAPSTASRPRSAMELRRLCTIHLSRRDRTISPLARRVPSTTATGLVALTDWQQV